jgi:hypothetical protein
LNTSALFVQLTYLKKKPQQNTLTKRAVTISKYI